MSALNRNKGEAPKLRQQPGPLSRTKVATKAAQAQSSRQATDSRSVVIERQSRAEMQARDAAPHHELTPAQRRRLSEIAERTICDESKVQTALREVGDLTACDLAFSLRISAPHARLSELRRSGVPIIPAGWVRQPWGSGRARILKLYTMGADQ